MWHSYYQIFYHPCWVCTLLFSSHSAMSLECSPCTSCNWMSESCRYTHPFRWMRGWSRFWIDCTSIVGLLVGTESPCYMQLTSVQVVIHRASCGCGLWYVQNRSLCGASIVILLFGFTTGRSFVLQYPVHLCQHLVICFTLTSCFHQFCPWKKNMP